MIDTFEGLNAPPTHTQTRLLTRWATSSTFCNILYLTGVWGNEDEALLSVFTRQRQTTTTTTRSLCLQWQIVQSKAIFKSLHVKLDRQRAPNRSRWVLSRQSRTEPALCQSETTATSIFLKMSIKIGPGSLHCRQTSLQKYDQN